MKVAHPEPVSEPEQKQAVVVTLYANEQIPVHAVLEDFPAPPSFGWCLVFAWRMIWAFALVSLPFWMIALILGFVTGALR